MLWAALVYLNSFMKLNVNFCEYLVASRRFCLRNKRVMLSLGVVGMSSVSSVYPTIP